MRFASVHKVASYATALTALSTLLLSGHLPPLGSGLALVALALSWFWEPPRISFARLQLMWNVSTLLAFAATIALTVLTNTGLVPGVGFVVFLSMVKAFNRQASQDYLQWYVLGLMQVVAASALHASAVFGALLFLYTLTGVCSLALLHLRSEIESNELQKYRGDLQGTKVRIERVLRSRRLVSTRFLMATALAGLAVFTLGGLLFFLMPRIGLNAHGGHASNTQMTGFAEQIELGRFGRIKDNPTVVLRVYFDHPQHRHLLRPYYRGRTFDRYDGHRWTKTIGRRRISTGGRYAIASRHQPGQQGVKQRIHLEPMSTRTLFGLSHFYRVELLDKAAEMGAIQVDRQGDVYHQLTTDAAIRYLAFSELERDDAAIQETPRAVYLASVPRLPDAHRYLQLPSELSPQVEALARRIVGDATTMGEVVGRLERHLRTQYRYTVDLKRTPNTDPLEDFLFHQRAGHCEYFSTAMVVMLRTLGVPARNVNGFYGGTWNEYGGFLALSQHDAHSWLEVWAGPTTMTPQTPHGRWLTRDPTPPQGRSAPRAGALGWLSGLVNAAQQRWQAYIVDYDLSRQLSAARQIGGVLKGVTAEVHITPNALGIVGLLLAALTWRLRRRWPRPRWRTPRPKASDDLTHLFKSMTKRYAKIGHVRADGETAREYLARLQTAQAPALEVAAAIVDAHEAARFAERPPPTAVIVALRRQLKLIRRPHDDDAPPKTR